MTDGRAPVPASGGPPRAVAGPLAPGPHAPLPPTTPSRPLADPQVRRVAVVRLRVGLGDLLASVPALRALRAARPDVEVTVITFPGVEAVLRRQAAYVDEMLPFPGHPGIAERRARLDLLPAFLRAARARRFDLAIQMYGGQRTANEITDLLGARRTGGFFTPGAWTPDLSTHLPYPFRAREVRRHLDLVEYLGVPPGSEALEFPLTDADRHEAAEVHRHHALRPGGYAVVHPGASAESRRWPAERFAAVADGLAAQGLQVVVSGVAAERRLTAETIRHMRAPAVDLCGATTLGGFAAVLHRAAVLVANDSGPAHLAAALGVPSVTVFLAGDPQRWAHTGPAHQVAQAYVHCQPCGYQRCPIDFRCARELATEQVLARAADLAGATSKERV